MVADHVARERARFARGELREGGIRTAVRSRDRRAIAQRPHGGMARAPQRRVDDDPSAFVVLHRDLGRSGVRNDAGGEDDRAGVDRLVGEMDAAGFDGLHGCSGADVGTAFPEHVDGDVGELRVDLRQDARACLDEMEGDLFIAKAGVIPQHVGGERGELAEQLDADEPTADHDGRQQPLPLGGVGRSVGALEALEQVVPQQECVRHGLEGHRGGGAGDEGLVRRAAERDDEVVVGEVVRGAAGRGGVHDTSIDVDVVHGRLDEARVSAGQGGWVARSGAARVSPSTPRRGGA